MLTAIRKGGRFFVGGAKVEKIVAAAWNCANLVRRWYR